MGRGPYQLSLFHDPSPPAPTLPDAGEVTSAEGLTVRHVECRTLLNRLRGGGYSLNCYVGCGHGCAWCYARYMQRFHPHEEPWGAFVDVKMNALDALARQLRRLPPGQVFTSSACDGWQPVERHYRLTRHACRMLLGAGFRLLVLTRSPLVLRDLDVLQPGKVRLGVTITTPDDDAIRLWEPGAPALSQRLEVLRQAREAGLETWLMLAPILPGVSDDSHTLRRMFTIAGDLGVSRVAVDTLNPRPLVWPSVEALLQTHRPDLLPRYRRLLSHRPSMEAWRREIGARAEEAWARVGPEARLSLPGP